MIRPHEYTNALLAIQGIIALILIGCVVFVGIRDKRKADKAMRGE